MDLNDYFYFVHVVENKGFAPASRALDIPKSRFSRHVQQLEERLGIRLIQRTSRRFAVTDAGLAFYRHARAAIDEVETAEAAVIAHAETLRGRVRVTCSVGMAQFALSEIISRFLQISPHVEVSQHVTNESVDLVKTGIDMAIRGHTGALPDSTLIRRHLAPTPWRLFAGEPYLERFGTPITPQDLEGADGLKLGWATSSGQWSLRRSDNESRDVPFSARLCSDDMETLKQAAADGLGIVALPAYVCRREVTAQRLIPVLPDWSAGDAQISLLMPSRKGIPPVVEAFSAFLQQEFPKVTMT